MEKNSFIYSRAAELLFDRFPTLALMASSWNEEKVQDEPLPTFEIDKAEVLYFYGLSNGSIYLKMKEWLKNPEKKLVILEDNPGIIASFLHTPLAIEMLSCPQVHLEFFFKTKEEIEAIVNQFPFRRVAVEGLASKEGIEDLRLSILRKTTLIFALKQDRLHGHQPFYNFCKNLRHLPHSFYANALRSKFKKRSSDCVWGRTFPFKHN